MDFIKKIRPNINICQNKIWSWNETSTVLKQWTMIEKRLHGKVVATCRTRLCSQPTIAIGSAAVGGVGRWGGGRGNSGPTPISLGDDGHAGRGTGRHRRPDAAGREHFGAPVVGAGADRPHLVAQLGRHHPQELVPLLRQRLRRLHRTLPAGPRLPLPAETATTTTATTTTAAAAAAAAARSRKQSVVSVPVSSFSSLPWRRRAR